MAASEATLTEVLVDDAYEKLEATNEKLKAACAEVVEQLRPARLHRGHGRQGLRHLLPRADLRVPRLPDQGRRRARHAGWLYHMNHGIFMTPGVEEEWTLSVAHSDDDVERYLNAFETFARDVTSG